LNDAQIEEAGGARRARRAWLSSWMLAAVLAVVPVTLGAPDARAEPPPAPRTASLAWVRAPGAESCIGPRALTAGIEAKLGRQAITVPARADLAIEGRAERLGPVGPWRIAIAVVGEAGEVLGLRELGTEAQDCRTLDDEIALVIAVLIEPGAALPMPTPAPAPRLPAPPPLPPLPPLPCVPGPLPAPPSPPPLPWSAGAEAGVIGGIGMLPSAALGVAFRGRVTSPRWPSFEVGGAVWIHQAAAPGPVGATFTLGWGSLAVCPLEVERSGNGLRLCLGGVAGALRADTVGLSPPQHLEQLVLDVDAEVRYRRRLVGPLVASAGFGLLVPTRRDQFFYVDAAGVRRDVFRMTAVAGSAEVTLGVALP
jgi:hypothetical protein